MEVPHTDLTEVTGVVLVEVGAVVVLTTGHTTTTGVLTVLANATVTGRDMTAAKEEDTKVSFLVVLVDGAEGGRMRPQACRKLTTTNGTVDHRRRKGELKRLTLSLSSRNG